MFRITCILGAFFSACVAGLVGCSQNNSDQHPDQALAEYGYRPVKSSAASGEDQAGSALPASSASSYATEVGRQSLKGISVAVPDDWVTVPPSGMRLAEYTLPDDDGTADASLTVFYFGPDRGGSVEANIERWYGQFSQPDGGSTEARSRRWEAKVGEMSVSHVDITGNFSGGMAPMAGAGSAQEGFRMLGSIVMAPSGPYFFKLVGPATTVQTWSQSYDGFIAGIQPE